ERPTPVRDCSLSARAVGSRLDINAADEGTLARVLETAGWPEARADSAAAAIADWIEANDEPRPQGAERTWYVARNRVPPSNSALVDMRELRGIRGLEDETADQLDSILDVEPGAIALNLAPREILSLLPGFNDRAIREVLDARARGVPITAFIQLRPWLDPAVPDASAKLPGLVLLAPEAWIVTARVRTGAPPVTTATALRAARGDRTTRVQPTGAGTAIAAALDRPYVDAVRAACREGGWRMGPIAPTAVVLTRAFTGPAFHWNDGPLTIEVSRNATGALDAVRTRPAREDDADATTLAPVAELAALGPGAARFADAFGAAAVDAREPLTLTADGFDLRAIALPRRTVTLVSAVLAMTVGAVGLSPLAAKWAGQRALARVHQLRPGRWQVISTSLGQLDRVSAILRQARSFTDSRTSLGTLLGELTHLLPEQSAVVNFEWTDVAGGGGGHGEVTVVTTNPTAVLAALRRLPGVGTVALVGNVSRL